MEKKQQLYVEEVTPTEGQAWAEVRSFLASHLPHSWKLFGPLLFKETAKGASTPRDDNQRWFVAKSEGGSGAELRGVLLVAPLGKAGAPPSSNVSLFVPHQHNEAGEDVVRALLGKVELTPEKGQVRYSGVAHEWLPVLREHAAAAGAHESWVNPCLALHCTEARFVRPKDDPTARLHAESLRLDSITPSQADIHTVVSQWKYAGEESDNYIAACVEHAPTACLRQGDGEMVAWIGVHTYMALGYFWVQESHRRKGLGKILAVDQTLKTFDYVRPYMAPEQVSAYMFTEADNHASRTLFESLGFELYSQVVWVAFKHPGAQVSSDEEKQSEPAPKAMAKVNLAEKLSLFTEHWSPKIVDNFDVKVAKLKGEFVWHHHENEDEMFLIIKGNLIIKVRERDGSERDIDLHEGDFFVVPKGVEHKPVAAEECHVMLLEQRNILHTGNVRCERTVDKLERI